MIKQVSQSVAAVRMHMYAYTYMHCVCFVLFALSGIIRSVVGGWWERSGGKGEFDICLTYAVMYMI